MTSRSIAVGFAEDVQLRLTDNTALPVRDVFSNPLEDSWFSVQVVDGDVEEPCAKARTNERAKEQTSRLTDMLTHESKSSRDLMGVRDREFLMARCTPAPLTHPGSDLRADPS